MQAITIAIVAFLSLFVVLLTILKIYLVKSVNKCSSCTKLFGKTVIITGANSGIGKETALDLAKRGARVILACRNLEQAEETRKEIIAKTKNDQIIVHYIDFEVLETVRKFSKIIHQTEDRLDILINNAGGAGFNGQITMDGFQKTMQINHFGPFLLTNLLLDMLKKSTPSRIVTVTSYMYRKADLDPNDLNKDFTSCNLDLVNYANSKLCNVLMSNYLAKLLEGTDVTSNCLHPGLVRTSIYRHLMWVIRIPIQTIAFFFKSSKEGAQTTIHVAVCEKIKGVSGEFFVNCRKGWLKSYTRSEQLQSKVWRESVNLIKLQSQEIHY